MPVKARRKEVWQIDFGLAQKVRPGLLLTDYPQEDELALLTVISHTTSVRGNRWELQINKPFLKAGVFHLQQINTIGSHQLLRRLGALTEAEMKLIEEHLRRRLTL